MHSIDWKIRGVAASLIAVALWFVADFYGPWHSDLRQFSPEVTAQLETDLWKSYYSHNRTGLYFGMVRLLRTQEGFPPIRAAVAAYWAGKAAALFQEGRRRSDYARALPDLERYFGAICRTGNLDRNPMNLAGLELDWWIIHRERGIHGESALVRAIADSAAALYGVDEAALIPYGRFRARAMLNRTEWSQQRRLTEADWAEVQSDLLKGYQALSTALSHPH